MELKEFISRSLSDIVEGISDAQNALAKKADLNPKFYGATQSTVTDEKGRKINIADFDIAVEVLNRSSTQEASKAGLGILYVVSAGVSTDAKSATDGENRSVQRIKISVPYTLKFGD